MEDELSDEQKYFIDELEPLNIEARYQTYKEKLFKKLSFEKCKKIITNTEGFVQWIKKKL